MEIQLENIGKRYIHNWIFRNINVDFEGPVHYGILGNNGSGKTTLLKILSGILSPTEGKVKWQLSGQDISDSLPRKISWASPHLELIEEFNLRETLTFHAKFKSWVGNHNTDSLIDLSELRKSIDKPLKYFSSGMKQRVKLILAVMSDVELIILDEPCTNLDEHSIAWYRNLVNQYAAERLLIIGSNDPENECFSCREFFTLEKTFKPVSPKNNF